MNKSKYLLCTIIIYYCTILGAQADPIEDCVDGIDQLKQYTKDSGITLSQGKRKLNKLTKACEKALQQTPLSTTLHLNLASVLIWNNKDSTGIIHIETLLNSDKELEALSLANALCAYGRGGQSGLQSACKWSTEYGIENPDLALKAAKSRFANRDHEIGFSFMSQAALSGSQDAMEYMNKLCSDFDPSPNRPFKNLPTEISSLDPYLIAAKSCESAFSSAIPDTPEWADYGFKYAEAIIYFDDYEESATTLLALGQASDSNIIGGAIDILDSLCTATAGDLNDPDYGAQGIADIELLPDRSQPVCEAAAYLWPDNGRLHYNLSRVYSLLGPSEQANAEAALDEAERLGYSLAKQLTARSAVPFNFNDFSLQGIVRAFHEKDMNSLNKEPYYILAYAMGIHESLSQDSILLLYEKDEARKIIKILDATLSHKAARKFSDPNFTGKVINDGLNSIFGIFKGMADVRSRGGTVTEEVSAMHDAILNTPGVKAEKLKLMGNQDGKILITLWETNPQDFEKVYSGLKMFIEM